MRITADTPLDDLNELRKSFVPRWAAEARLIKEARDKYQKGDQPLIVAEQRYADFETVATAVIQITNLRTQPEQGTELLAAVLEEEEETADDNATEPLLTASERAKVRHALDHLDAAMRTFDQWVVDVSRGRGFGDAVSTPAMNEAYAALATLESI